MDTSGDDLADEAVELARDWLRRAANDESHGERTMARRMAALVAHSSDVEFTMAWVDRVARHRNNKMAAAQLRDLVANAEAPRFLGPLDRLLLGLGARLATVIPGIAMPIARRRMRHLVGRMVIDAEPSHLRPHLAEQRAAGFALNVNLLGETVLGEAEADRRLAATLELIDQPDISYVSVKVSGITSQIDLWSFDDSLDHVKEGLRSIFAHSAAATPPTFVNLDMEEYHDLEITARAFTEVLDEPEFRDLDAGIVLQAYIPESFPAMVQIVEWANGRHESGAGQVKIRLVKGANLAMERVDAAIHRWTQAPYDTKADVDANYKRCLDWVMEPSRLKAVRVGVASHNLFDIAWAKLLADQRGVPDRVGFEMLQGMAPAQSRTVRDSTGNLLLYTPIVTEENFDVAISYLIRRLEENTAPDNFLRHLFGLDPDGPDFDDQADRFRKAVAARHQISSQTHRRPLLPDIDTGFANHPSTDVSQPDTRSWLRELRDHKPGRCTVGVVTDQSIIEATVSTARSAHSQWWEMGAARRRAILWEAADQLDSRRGELLVTMAHETNKVFAESDAEITEAIDFARWYGDKCIELEQVDGGLFKPLGIMAVVPPWNFPVAIPAGGVFAALAVGNSVILKPTPEAPRCGEIVAEACWAAGVPRDVLQFVRTPDDQVGRALVTSVDGVIFTGSWETAQLFRSWKPDMRLFAETSGKNAMIITPHADFDLAVADLVHSAFGHVGQKCSAASLGILVGSAYDSDRLRRQLVDAVSSLQVGSAHEPSTRMGPTIGPVSGKLKRALTQLDGSETWLLEPHRVDDAGELWTPGIRLGVAPVSWFQQTECFGPVLGLIHAETLDQAIRIQNSSAYGLTGGIHTLDHREIDEWTARVEVGNAYINRGITGAIVNRQPFGGWKRSSIGPGAKAGGPDYLLQLGDWRPDKRANIDSSFDDSCWWKEQYSAEHDPSGLFCEANVHRYPPMPNMVLRITAEASAADAERAIAAALLANPDLQVSVDPAAAIPAGIDSSTNVVAETVEQLVSRLDGLRWGRIRMVGHTPTDLRRAALEAEVTIIDEAVTPSGRLELRHYLREQSVSRTLHRFGNVPSADRIARRNTGSPQ